MKKIAMVLAAGFVMLAGAALADQSVHVDGNVNNPVTGSYPVEYEATGLPTDAVDVSPGAVAGEANAAFEQHEVPFALQVQENGVRPNAKCALPSAAQDALPPGTVPSEACITDEPTVPYPENGLVDVGPNGIRPKQWITISSGEALDELPEEIPPEQREAIEEAHSQVNAEVTTSFQQGAGDDKTGSGARIPGFETRSEADRARLIPTAPVGMGDLGLGSQEDWTPAGFEEYFEPGATPLGGTTKGYSTGSTEAAGSGAGSGADLVSMAAAAALIGGAVLAPMALYHRIRANHALNNKTRQAVFDAVVQSPGLGVNDAAKAANCSYSTAAYHLERLVEARLLVASEDGRRARYFKNGGAFSQQEREFVPILQSKEAMDVLQVIVENPWCYRAEVAQRLGVSGPTVNWHLKKLMGAGVVKEMREGRVSYLYADKKLLSQIGANLVGKMSEDLVARLRFERRPEPELVEPALGLPETRVPDVGVDELELAPLPESR